MSKKTKTFRAEDDMGVFEEVYELKSRKKLTTESLVAEKVLNFLRVVVDLEDPTVPNETLESWAANIAQELKDANLLK